MSLEKPDNERRIIYERFKKSLTAPKGGADGEFFDADDLVMVIDYCVDIHDEYVRLEAVMSAYRYFPDSDDLAVRRAQMFLDLDLSDGVRNMVRGVADGEPAGGGRSPIWRLLELQDRLLHNSSDPTDDDRRELRRAITEVMEGRTEPFDDETIITITDCAALADDVEWLNSIEPRLRQLCDYLPTLLYELYQRNNERGDTDRAIALLEELTELEPFNASFWGMLAAAQHDKGRDREALASVEYALAIDSDDLTANHAKAILMLEQDRYAEALAALDAIGAPEEEPTAEQQKEYQDVRAMRIQILEILGMEERARKEAAEAFRLYPASRELLLAAINAGGEQADTDALLNAHMDAQVSAGDFTAALWLDWAREAYTDGRPELAAIIYAKLYSIGLLPAEDEKYLVSSFWAAESYIHCYELLTDTLDGKIQMQPSPDMITAGILSALRLGRKEDAAGLLRRIERKLPLDSSLLWHVSSGLTALGLSNLLAALGQIVKQPEMPDESLYALFKYPDAYTAL